MLPIRRPLEMQQTVAIAEHPVYLLQTIFQFSQALVPRASPRSTLERLQIWHPSVFVHTFSIYVHAFRFAWLYAELRFAMCALQKVTRAETRPYFILALSYLSGSERSFSGCIALCSLNLSFIVLAR